MGKSSKNMSAEERYAHMMDACVAHGSARAVVCAFSGCQGWTGGFEEEMAGKLAEQQIALLAVPLIDLKYTKPAAQDIFAYVLFADFKFVIVDVDADPNADATSTLTSMSASMLMSQTTRMHRHESCHQV